MLLLAREFPTIKPFSCDGKYLSKPSKISFNFIFYLNRALVAIHCFMIDFFDSLNFSSLQKLSFLFSNIYQRMVIFSMRIILMVYSQYNSTFLVCSQLLPYTYLANVLSKSSHFSTSLCFFSVEEKSVLISVWSLEIQISRRESWDPFYESPPPNFVPVSTQNFAKENYLKLLFTSLRCNYTINFFILICLNLYL